MPIDVDDMRTVTVLQRHWIGALRETVRPLAQRLRPAACNFESPF
jgi:hypothetical protein